MSEKRQQYVLNLAVKDSAVIFGKWTLEGEGEVHLKYLGDVHVRDGRVFKVMTSRWEWGLSHRATSRILIYNQENQYLGNYYVDVANDLPDKLDNGKLIFTVKDALGCEAKGATTEVDFSHGLPWWFYIACGNVHPFE